MFTVNGIVRSLHNTEMAVLNAIDYIFTMQTGEYGAGIGSYDQVEHRHRVESNASNATFNLKY